MLEGNEQRDATFWREPLEFYMERAQKMKIGYEKLNNSKPVFGKRIAELDDFIKTSESLLTNFNLLQDPATLKRMIARARQLNLENIES